MKSQLTIFESLLMVLILLACGLAFISYGWIAYSIIMERSGMYGNLYWYYQADKIGFTLYQLLIALLALFISARILYFAYLGDRQKLKRGFIHFAIFLLILILCEIYLDTRYVGKG